MTQHEPTTIVLFESNDSLAWAPDGWLRAHFAEPLHIATVHTLSGVLAYLRSHRVDLVLVDEAGAGADLRSIHSMSPTTAIIALVMRMEPSVLLHALRQGAHEALCLLPSTDGDHGQVIERALARVNGRTGILKDTTPRSPAAAAMPRLIHDLNNLLTSINGFADLLLHQLPPDHPARMGAEQIRLAGKRATSLLKTHSTTTSVSPAPPTATTQPVPARAA